MKSRNNIIAKKKSFIFIILLSIVLLFSTAALCNSCQTNIDDESVKSSESAVAAQTNMVTDTLSPEEQKQAEADKAMALAGETTATGEGGTGITETTSALSSSTESAENPDATNPAMSSPTIRLAVYAGPVFSSADGIYYYRVEATVTGDAPVTVSFSRDDSHGAWGVRKVQVNLSPGQVYTLTASASNSTGSAAASVTLTAPGGTSGSSTSSGTNSAPTAGEINFSSSTIITNVTYNASVSASDADGDALSYNWSATSGSITNSNVNPVQYKTPGTPGNVTISVVISDSHGATITKTKTIAVSYPTAGIDSPEAGIVTPVTINVPVINSEGGYVEYNNYINYGGCLYAGDSNTDRPCKGFISFDITGLSGATINSAYMTFNIKSVYGSGGLGSLCVGTHNWGTNPIYNSLYDDGYATGLGYYETPSFTISNVLLKNALQGNILYHMPRFQVVIAFTGGGSDVNGAWDGWEYRQSDITLTVNYTPGT